MSFNGTTGLGVFRSSTTSYGVTDATFTTNAANGSTYWGSSKTLVGFTRVTADYDRGKDIWVSFTDTSKRPALETAPALPFSSTGNTLDLLLKLPGLKAAVAPLATTPSMAMLCANTR